MILIIKSKTLLIAVVLMVIAVAVGIRSSHQTGVVINESNYRVFVAGTGTVEGKWYGQTGVAVIGLETRPSTEDNEELKVIDLLVANGTSERIQFDADVTLINPRGERFSLKAAGQPRVFIGPGSLSQGTIVINVPKGTPDRFWLLEIRGGHPKEGIILPLKVLKVKE